MEREDKMWGTHLGEIQSSHLKRVTFDGFQCRPGGNVRQTVDWYGVREKFHGEASGAGNTCKSTALKCLLEAKTNKGNNVDKRRKPQLCPSNAEKETSGQTRMRSSRNEGEGNWKKMSQGSRKNASGLSQVPPRPAVLHLLQKSSRRAWGDISDESFLHSPAEGRSYVSLPEKGSREMDR